MNKRLLIIIGSILMQLNVSAQAKAGLEVYKYMHAQIEGSFQPLAHIQTAKNWYGELRYNYEDAKTLSLYGGRTFTDSGCLQYTFTPMVGFSAGRFGGISFAFNTETDWRKFYFASQTQYSIAIKKNSESFFFSWSEAGYTVCEHFYTGLAMQYTLQAGLNEFEPGFLAGLHFGDLYIPFYVFGPFHSGRYFVLGLIYELKFEKKK
jgi:hypothetical protein